MAVNINTLITGTMTLGTGGSTPTGHSDTRVTYVSGHDPTSWSGEIEGELGDGLIPNSEYIETVDIGNRVTSLGMYAFGYKDTLISVTIPNSVTNIEDGAFNDCNNLTSIVFQGKTLEQVQNIEDKYGNKHYPWGISDTSIITVA